MRQKKMFATCISCGIFPLEGTERSCIECRDLSSRVPKNSRLNEERKPENGFSFISISGKEYALITGVGLHRWLESAGKIRKIWKEKEEDARHLANFGLKREWERFASCLSDGEIVFLYDGVYAKYKVYKDSTTKTIWWWDGTAQIAYGQKGWTMVEGKKVFFPETTFWNEIPVELLCRIPEYPYTSQRGSIWDKLND